MNDNNRTQEQILEDNERYEEMGGNEPGVPTLEDLNQAEVEAEARVEYLRDLTLTYMAGEVAQEISMVLEHFPHYTFAGAQAVVTEIRQRQHDSAVIEQLKSIAASVAGATS